MSAPLHTVQLAARISQNFLRMTSFATALTVSILAVGQVPAPLFEITSGLPGNQVRLTWPAVAGTRYRVEKSATLDGWKQVALVEATGSEGMWLDPEQTTTKSFYRVVQPVAEVFSISPPLLSQSGGLLVVQGQSIPAGSFLVLNVNGQLLQVSLSSAGGGMWEASVTGQFVVDSRVIATGIVDSAGATIVSLNVPITVTTTGRALDAPPTLPRGAPVVQDAVKPIKGIGIVVKKNPGHSAERKGGLGSSGQDGVSVMQDAVNPVRRGSGDPGWERGTGNPG